MKELKSSNFLRVSEKFFSIQGEGITVGTPSIFLRLGGCNLLCKSDSWVCDTIEVWSKSKKIKFKDIFDNEEIVNLRRGVHLIITGGEPLLHQKQLSRFLVWFEDKYGFLPIIEVETNGTIKPLGTISKVVGYWNISPKLSNSGEDFSKRYNRDSLDWFSKKENVNWKIVISNKADVLEFFKDFFFITLDKRLAFMPAGDSQENIAEVQLKVIELCKEWNVRFSPRLQVNLYNKATGV